ncbi:hypothetical protein RB195_007083 [Necator americanus]|uniref:Uncharacterized protein n=1 Tax=Necator americanus TaxID=51031 RepID=A0ABR1BVI3_NECAM
MFVSTSANAAAARIPMIKFVGARLPRPNFSRVTSASVSATSGSPVTSSTKPSSGSLAHTSHGSVISEENLPHRFRRAPISQEECDAINAGGAYGL